jgi:predicted O-methyltransferase YrrM
MGKFNRILTRLRSVGLKKALQMKWENFLWTKLFSFGEAFGLSILPSHFYSPVPNTRELRRSLQRWSAPSELAGVNMNMPAQRAWLTELERYKSELARLPDYDSTTQMGLGEGYAVVDAHILYATLRHVKPKRIIEVGSGVSTFFELEALRANAQENEREAVAKARLTCIEPYPRKGLTRLAESGAVELIVKPVQDVPVATFQQLEAGDVLFIDSSHVLKLDSDVYYLYLEVLPRLKSGVVIHIHDIFFPYPTPEPETWIFRQHQFWNEVPLVQAMLMYTIAFEVLLCGSYVQHTSPQALREVIAAFDPPAHVASSLWLRKTM